MLAGSNAVSLLDRSADEWVALLGAANRTANPGAVGFLRYARRHIETLADGGGVDAEYRRDVWDARRLGVPVTVGHHRVSFERIVQRWLRDAVKAWARARLVGGMSFGAIRRDTTAMSWFASWLESSRPQAPDASVITRTTIEAYLAHLAARGPDAPNTRVGYPPACAAFSRWPAADSGSPCPATPRSTTTICPAAQPGCPASWLRT